jgi:hypothetical protein
MSLLVNLPIQISLSILSDWIQIQDISSLDIAFCSHPIKNADTQKRRSKVSRQDFLQVLQDPNFILSDPHLFFTKEANNVKFLKWLAKRGIKTSHLIFSMTSLPEIVSFEHLNFTKLKEIHFMFQGKKLKKKKSSFLNTNGNGEDNENGNQAHQSSSQQLIQFTSNVVGHVMNFLHSATAITSPRENHSENEDRLPSCLDDSNLLLLSRQLPSTIEKITFFHWKEINNNQLNLLLSKSNIYLKSLNLSKCSFITDDSIVLIFQQYYHCLEELNLSCCSLVTGLFFPVIKSLCRRFRSLNISYCHGLKAELLEMFLSEYKELTSLHCEDLLVLNNEILEAFVTGNDKIKFINVDYCRNVSIDCLNRLLLRQPFLETFIARDCCYQRQSPVNNNNGNKLQKVISSREESFILPSSSSNKENNKIENGYFSPYEACKPFICYEKPEHMIDAKELISKELILKGCYTRQAAIIQLLSTFPNDSFSSEDANIPVNKYHSGRKQDWKGLQSINATECRKLGNESVLIIGRKFANSLISLKLSPWKDIELSTFQFLFQQCVFLQVLNLSYCETLTDNICNTVIASHLHGLKEIYFNHCPLISDEGMIPVFQACPHLKIVELENCLKITNESLRALFEYNYHLEKINFFATGITSECFQYLIFQSSSNDKINNNDTLLYTTALEEKEEIIDFKNDHTTTILPASNINSYWDHNENKCTFQLFVSEYWRDSQYWKYHQMGNSFQKMILKKVQFLPTPMYHYHTNATINS